MDRMDRMDPGFSRGSIGAEVVRSRSEREGQGSVVAALETYKVVYRGGHPDYPKSKVAEILFHIHSDRFEFVPTNTSRWWALWRFLMRRFIHSKSLTVK